MCQDSTASYWAVWSGSILCALRSSIFNSRHSKAWQEVKTLKTWLKMVSADAKNGVCWCHMLQFFALTTENFHLRENSMDLDQTVPYVAVWSWSTLFNKETPITIADTNGHWNKIILKLSAKIAAENVYPCHLPQFFTSLFTLNLNASSIDLDMTAANGTDWSRLIPFSMETWYTKADD